MLRRLMRRLVIWALSDQEAVMLVNWDIKTGRNRLDPTDIFIRGAQTEAGHKIIINTIQRAKLNREL